MTYIALNDLAEELNAALRDEAHAAADYDYDPNEGYEPDGTGCVSCGRQVEAGEGCWHDPTDVYCVDCSGCCVECDEEAAERAAEADADWAREVAALDVWSRQ